MTHTELKAALVASGIRNTEAAQLFRISLATLYRWFEPESKPKQKVVYEVAMKYVSLIQEATEKGYLPVKDVVGKGRMPAIAAAVRRTAAERI